MPAMGLNPGTKRANPAGKPGSPWDGPVRFFLCAKSRNISRVVSTYKTMIIIPFGPPMSCRCTAAIRERMLFGLLLDRRDAVSAFFVGLGRRSSGCSSCTTWSGSSPCSESSSPSSTSTLTAYKPPPLPSAECAPDRASQWLIVSLTVFPTKWNSITPPVLPDCASSSSQ